MPLPVDQRSPNVFTRLVLRIVWHQIYQRILYKNLLHLLKFLSIVITERLRQVLHIVVTNVRFGSRFRFVWIWVYILLYLDVGTTSRFNTLRNLSCFYWFRIWANATNFCNHSINFVWYWRQGREISSWFSGPPAEKLIQWCQSASLSMWHKYGSFLLTHIFERIQIMYNILSIRRFVEVSVESKIYIRDIGLFPSHWSVVRHLFNKSFEL